VENHLSGRLREYFRRSDAREMVQVGNWKRKDKTDFRIRRIIRRRRIAGSSPAPATLGNRNFYDCLFLHQIFRFRSYYRNAVYCNLHDFSFPDLLLSRHIQSLKSRFFLKATILSWPAQVQWHLPGSRGMIQKIFRSKWKYRTKLSQPETRLE
jgi:hypothetical protein